MLARVKLWGKMTANFSATHLDGFEASKWNCPAVGRESSKANFDRLSNATGVPGACNQCAAAAQPRFAIIVCACVWCWPWLGLCATPQQRREAAQLLILGVQAIQLRYLSWPEPSYHWPNEIDFDGFLSVLLISSPKSGATGGGLPKASQRRGRHHVWLQKKPW